MNLSLPHVTTTSSPSFPSFPLSLRESTSPIIIEELGLIDYMQAWDYQRQLVQQRTQKPPDTLLLLEHYDVFTAGKRTEPIELPNNTVSIPLIAVDRGGKITWHGPGQLIGYPIIKLSEPLNVVEFVRRIEQAIVATCHEFGVNPVGIAGKSGVWIVEKAPTHHVNNHHSNHSDDNGSSNGNNNSNSGDGSNGNNKNNNSSAKKSPTHTVPVSATIVSRKKIAAIGIRISQGITQHGFAINCNNTLEHFAKIIPCGIPNAGVTSLTEQTGCQITVADVIPVISRYITPALEGTLDIDVDIIDDDNS